MQMYQFNQLTMHSTLLGVLDENEVKFDLFPAYPAVKSALGISIAEEYSLAGLQESSKRNSIAARDLAKGVAVEFIIDLSGKVSALATFTDNMTLLDTVRFCASKVKRFSDNKLVLFFGTIMNSANENKVKALDFGVTDQMLSDGVEILAKLKTEMLNLRLSNVGQKQLTEQLKKQFAVTRSSLRIIDSMIETFRLSDPVLHRSCQNARKIKNLGGTKLSAWGKVFDADTKLPLPKAKISVVSYDSSKSLSGADLVKNVKIAGALGGFRLKSLATGTYIFKVSYAGYADQEVTVHINQGILTRVEIALTKLGTEAGN